MKSFNKIVTHCFLLLLLPLLLSGCGAALNPYNEDFACQAPEESGHCVDTKTAYEEAIGFNLATDEKKLPDNNVNAARLELVAQLLKEPQTPMIVPARILRVLILPYKGNGDLFMARYAYLQVEPARWVLTGIDEGIE